MVALVFIFLILHILMTPEILTLPAITLVGIPMKMSIANDQTQRLWQAFMPQRTEIDGVETENEYYSVQVYPQDYFAGPFSPEKKFVKWAAVAVRYAEDLPVDMDVLELPAGRYARFTHRGPASEFFKTAQYIYGTWLAESNEQLAHAPHFQIMGEKYLGHDNPDSEEDVFVPLV